MVTADERATEITARGMWREVVGTVLLYLALPHLIFLTMREPAASLYWLVVLFPVAISTYVLLCVRVFRGRAFMAHGLGLWIVGLIIGGVLAGLFGLGDYRGSLFLYFAIMALLTSIAVVAAAVALWLASIVGGVAEDKACRPGKGANSCYRKMVWIVLQYVIFSGLYFASMLLLHVEQPVYCYEWVWAALWLGVVGYLACHLWVFRHQRFTCHSLGHLIAFFFAGWAGYACRPPSAFGDPWGGVVVDIVVEIFVSAQILLGIILLALLPELVRLGRWCISLRDRRSAGM